MANVRQSYLDDYSQNVDKVGIGTTISKEKLEIRGGISSKDLNVTGIATLTSASGFIKKNLEYVENVDIDAGDSGTLSDEIIVGAGLTVVVGTGATAGQGNIETLKVYKMFQPPSGTTNQRPVGKPGSLFYNVDFKTIEFFDGNSWRQVDNTTRRGRAVWAGGYDKNGTPSNTTKSIDFINVPTLGNSINFGELSSAGQDAHGCGSETRGIYMGSFNGAQMDYITIASEGDGIDFGDLTAARNYGGSGSSSTRGMHFGGDTPSTVNTIDYVEINTLGNAIDFGDMVSPRMVYGGALSNGRVIYTGGGDAWPVARTSYDRTIISSLGNSINFGDLIEKVSYGPSGNSNQVRGVLAGGYNSPSSPYYGKRIQYITMSSGGNAQYFGDLSTFALTSGAGVTRTRAVFSLGQVITPSSTDINTLEYISMASSGNSQDFGDLRGGNNRAHTRVISPVSDSHGGLGGF